MPLANMVHVDQMVSTANTAKLVGQVPTATMWPHAFPGLAVAPMEDAPNQGSNVNAIQVGMVTIVTDQNVLSLASLAYVAQTPQNASVRITTPVQRPDVIGKN